MGARPVDSALFWNLGDWEDLILLLTVENKE